MEILDKTFYFNTIGQWLISAGIVLAGVIIGKLMLWLFTRVLIRLSSKTKTQLDDILFSTSKQPLVSLVTVLTIWYALYRLNFPMWLDSFITKAIYFVIVINITWFIAKLVNALIETYIIPLAERTENELDDQLIPIIKKSLNIIIWGVGIVVALNNAGFNVGAIIAGMGIGGFALAMASKDTISNFFGGVTVFADHPFKVKDRIKISGYDGFVEEIGIRSTRLKTLEGRIVTIPNAKFIDNIIENVSMEPNRKVKLNLGLTYDTTPEKMQLAMDILKNIIKNNDNTEEDCYVSFNSFGDFALGILFIYYIKKGADILGTQSEINLQILKHFNENKLEFAFPTQTIYTINQ